MRRRIERWQIRDQPEQSAEPDESQSPSPEPHLDPSFIDAEVKSTPKPLWQRNLYQTDSAEGEHTVLLLSRPRAPCYSGPYMPPRWLATPRDSSHFPSP